MTKDPTEPDAAPFTGHAVIQSCLRTLTAQPGVYRMLDAEGRVLYVGKARNLKARVSNYARPSGHSARIARMIHATASMMFLTTRTETEALLLEQNLIKQLKPYFNVLLRDDKSFPNILVSKETDFAQIKKHRGAKKEKGSYYGPFASAGAVNRTLNQLQKVFLLRNCSDAMFSSRTRPCLLYQIKRCAAPCVGRIAKEDYETLVLDAERFLQGKTTQVQAKLGQEMAEASRGDGIRTCRRLARLIQRRHRKKSSQGINPRGVAEADVVALHMEGGQACPVLHPREPSWGNRDFYPKTGAGAGRGRGSGGLPWPVLHRQGTPRLILLLDPDRGCRPDDRASGRPAGRNRRSPRESGASSKTPPAMPAMSLARKMSESAAQSRLRSWLGEAFELDGSPRRIEVYDNSHIQGRTRLRRRP